jgi:hypothetical protein
VEKLSKFLELSKTAYLSFERANDQERRELLEILSSNLVADGKTVLVKLISPFDYVLARPPVRSGGPIRDASRTLPQLYDRLRQYFDIEPIPKTGWCEN